MVLLFGTDLLLEFGSNSCLDAVEFLDRNSPGGFDGVGYKSRKILGAFGKLSAKYLFELRRGSDVAFEALTADASPCHATENALLGLSGVVTVHVPGRHALEYVDLNEHRCVLFWDQGRVS
jgi:hypothetical protein